MINITVEIGCQAGYHRGMAAVSELSVNPSPCTDGVPAVLFRNVLGHFPTGVTVVTGRAGERPVGMAIGSFFSLSLDPSLVGFCAAKTSSSWSEIKRSGRFCANVLAHDQQELCRIFAVSGGDKFREVDWEPGASGAPRLDGVLAWVECTIEAVHDGGDHEICIGRVDALGIERNCAPLIFFRGGHSLNSACRHRGGTAPVRSRRPHRPCNSTRLLTALAGPARLASSGRAPAAGMISMTGTHDFGPGQITEESWIV
jgi:3-hydroxy-9,10-secoandrosta-1,3,5(10)-triene-9,17-dione monooxygenase reductase component